MKLENLYEMWGRSHVAFSSFRQTGPGGWEHFLAMVQVKIADNFNTVNIRSVKQMLIDCWSTPPGPHIKVRRRAYDMMLVTFISHEIDRGIYR